MRKVIPIARTKIIYMLYFELETTINGVNAKTTYRTAEYFQLGLLSGAFSTT
jgi:hypothetical protein